MPLATGQLFHAFVFDTECFPKVRQNSRSLMLTVTERNEIKAYGDFILRNTPTYVQRRPAEYPSNLSWPSGNEIVDNLAKISELKWPYVVPLPIHRLR